MFCLRLSLTVLTLPLIIASTTGAVVPLLPTTESESVILSENKTNSKELISDLKCECVSYFLCDRENVVVRPTSADDNDQNECTDNFVCCKTSSTELPSTTNPSSQENSTIHLPVDSGEENYTEEVTTTEATTDYGIIGQLCECVLPNQCHPENVLNLSFIGLQNPCQGESVCCAINSTPPLISQEMGSSGDNGTNESECECVSYYSCPKEDVIELPTTEEKCLISDVCCKKSNSTSLPSSQSTDPDPPPNNTNVITNEVSNASEQENSECECMSLSLCSIESIENIFSTGFDTDHHCSFPEICCKKSISTSTTTLKPPEVTTLNSTNKVITYGVSDDHNPEELKCKCILFDFCLEENVIDLTTTYNEKDRCSDSEVCCKIPDFTSTVSTELPKPAPSNDEKNEVVIHGVDNDNEAKELECECVSFYFCPAENVVKLPANRNNRDLCSESRVCCRRPDWSTSTSSISPPQEPPSKRPQLSTPALSISPPQEPPSKIPQLSTPTSSISPSLESPLPQEPLPPKNVRDGPITMEFSFKITWWR